MFHSIWDSLKSDLYRTLRNTTNYRLKRNIERAASTGYRANSMGIAP
jgi:hypothetical protein